MKRISSTIILLAVLSSGYWWFTRPSATALEPPALTGSGTIEAETVAITAELGGRILELKADEGDEVMAGQVLVELDRADLLAQQVQLEAALTTARANLELASALARPGEIAAPQAQLAQAELARDGARIIWQRAEALVNDPLDLDARISQARAHVTGAERDLEMARLNLKQMEIQAEAAGRNQTTVLGANEGLAQNDIAQYQLQAARTSVEMAEVALAGAKSQVAHLVRLRERPLVLIAQANAAEAALQQAEAAVLAAQANLAAVTAKPMAEDVAIAQAQVLEAEATLAIVNVQLARQTLTAPRAGLISRKLAEPGELAAPGAILLELSDLDATQLTVYLPETEIGRLKIGQQALVYVDAYPGEVFGGRVSFIAPQAEFTPRNTETPEERVNLVFAVKIKLDNAGHRLKPGMPANAEILPAVQANAVATPLPAALPPVTLDPTATSTPVKPMATPTVAPAVFETPPSVQAEVIAWGLNVRSGPGINYPIIASLTRGDTVPVVKVEPNSGWLQVRLPTGERTGWISGNPTYVLVE